MLTLINKNGKFLADSREVAVMVDKNHSDLLRSIKSYTNVLTESNFALSDFFVESTYQDSTGRTLPCYLITRKGCDMIANKMTGEKGILFTATYVTKFEEMEKQQQIDASKLSPTLQMLNLLYQSAAKSELKIQQLEGTVTTIKDTIIHQPDNWREDVNKMCNRIAKAIGDNQFREVRTESYKLLEQRAGVNLTARLDNLKIRMMKEGRTKTEIKKANKLDIVEADKKLREIYAKILQEYTIKYCA